MQSIARAGEVTDAYKNFINSLDSEASRRTYRERIPTLYALLQNR